MRNSCKHPVIVLTGIKYLHMKSLVEFIYNGEVNIFQENLAELLWIANILKIKGLDEMPPLSNDADDNMEDDGSKDNKLLVKNSLDKTIRDTNLPNTSDQAIDASSNRVKKRKSVSFSDTPEIVCDQQRFSTDASSTSFYEQHSESCSGNGKRKLRSLSNICSVTKIEKQPEEATVASVMASNTNDDNSSETANVVTVNPHTIYSSNESINLDGRIMGNDSVSLLSSSPKKPQPQQQQRSPSVSRKMIRKNENFLRALEAVRDEGIGFCKAAKIHGVNNRTLWLEYQKRGYPMKNARKKPH